MVSDVTPYADLVVRVATQVLESPVTLESNFFDAGGASLSALALTSLIQEELERDIPLDLVFEYPVLADFAREIAVLSESASATAV